MNELTSLLRLLYCETIELRSIIWKTLLEICWDFPGSPMVGTSPSNAEGTGLIPGWGVRIPRASKPEKQGMKQKQCRGKFDKG